MRLLPHCCPIGCLSGLLSGVAGIGHLAPAHPGHGGLTPVEDWLNEAGHNIRYEAGSAALAAKARAHHPLRGRPCRGATAVEHHQSRNSGVKRTARIAKLVSGGRYDYISLILVLVVIALSLYSVVTTSDSTAQWLSGGTAAMGALSILRMFRTRRAGRF